MSATVARKRGRPRNERVELASAFFPEAKSRRSRWNRYYEVSALKRIKALEMIPEEYWRKMRDGEAGGPLPQTVLAKLGTVHADDESFRQLFEICMECRSEGNTARSICRLIRAIELDAREPRSSIAT